MYLGIPHLYKVYQGGTHRSSHSTGHQQQRPAEREQNVTQDDGRKEASGQPLAHDMFVFEGVCAFGFADCI